MITRYDMIGKVEILIQRLNLNREMMFSIFSFAKVELLDQTITENIFSYSGFDISSCKTF